MSTSNEDWKKDLQKTGKELSEINKSTKRWLNGALIRWGIRWTITIILYLLLWNRFEWLRWTLIFTIPLGAFSLWKIISTQDKIDDLTEEINQTIEETLKMEEE